MRTAIYSYTIFCDRGVVVVFSHMYPKTDWTLYGLIIIVVHVSVEKYRALTVLTCSHECAITFFFLE
jgi:hypothetical protein